MFQNAAAPLRILLLVFLANSPGHHAAMAAAFAPQLAAAVTAAPVEGASGHHHDDCASGHCVGTDQACSITGQCWLALNPPADVILSAIVAQPAPLVTAKTLRPGPVDLPFRPPAA